MAGKSRARNTATVTHSLGLKIPSLRYTRICSVVGTRFQSDLGGTACKCSKITERRWPKAQVQRCGFKRPSMPRSANDPCFRQARSHVPNPLPTRNMSLKHRLDRLEERAAICEDTHCHLTHGFYVYGLPILEAATLPAEWEKRSVVVRPTVERASLCLKGPKPRREQAHGVPG